MSEESFTIRGGDMVVQSYHDLCKEIEILEMRIKDLKEEYNFYAGFLEAKPSGIRTSQIGHDKVQSSNPYMPPEEAYRRCAAINELLMRYDELVTNKLRTKQKMEKSMSDFETLEGKVNYMFHVKNMKLYEIADELGYSYGWIRHIKSRYDKSQRQHNFSK